MTFTKERVIEELKVSTQNARGMFEISEDTICALMELLESRADAGPVTPEDYVLVPVEMTPEQMRAVQIDSELGAYAAANLSGAYSLFREFWDVAIAAAPQPDVK